jgi:hypothetical protein
MNINPVSTKSQKQQLMRFIEENNLSFPHKSLHLFSISQFVRRRLLTQMGKTITNNEYQIKESYEEFLRRCSRKFGLYMSPQFINRGRYQPINPQDIIRFQSTSSLQDQLLVLSNYGIATLLGNTSAIAEISHRLFKITMYDARGNIDNRFKVKMVKLVEYGISRRCPDCLGVMACLLDHGLGIVRVDRQRSLKLAGQSAEAGSIYGWFALARLLKYNSDHASYHNEFDDGIDIDDSDLGVRQFVRSRIPLDEQIRLALEEHGCKLCLPQFYEGKETCRGCGFEFDVFNYYQDDDTSVPKSEQMRISVDIYYKILSENQQSHPICADSSKNLVKIYKAREQLFGGSIEATDEEIRRLEEI